MTGLQIASCEGVRAGEPSGPRMQASGSGKEGRFSQSGGRAGFLWIRLMHLKDRQFSDKRQLEQGGSGDLKGRTGMAEGHCLSLKRIGRGCSRGGGSRGGCSRGGC